LLFNGYFRLRFTFPAHLRNRIVYQNAIYVSDSLIIIPTYNEKENIEKIIRKVFSLTYSFHVLIIDDGSPDGTADIVKQLQVEFTGNLHLEEREGKLGLGTAYIHGFKWALARNYEYIFEMDADFSHNPEDLIKLLAACKNGADLAIGSRYVKGVNVVNWPMGRVLMSYFASMYVRFITRINIQDATAGFKCYRRIVLETIPMHKIKFVGYAFQIEMKFTAIKFGFKVIEVPIIFTDRTEGTSKMSTRIFREAFLGVIQMKVNSWFRDYRK
jgi:dolichol-phosphate mannosyltransferase